MPEKYRKRVAGGLAALAGIAAVMGVDVTDVEQEGLLESIDGAWVAVSGLFVLAAALIHKFTKD